MAKTNILVLIMLCCAACRNPAELPPITQGEEREIAGGRGIVEVGIGQSEFSALYDSAANRSNTGHPEAAINTYIQLCSLEAPSMKTYAYMGLGSAYMLYKDYAAAISSYRQSLQLDSMNKDSYVGLGSAYSASRDYPNAIKYYEKALHIDTDDASSYWGLAIVYHTLGDRQRTKENALRFIQLSPNSQYRQTMELWLQGIIPL